MKRQITHDLGETTLGEEFAFARLHRAKRLGQPVPRSAKHLLLEELKRPKPPTKITRRELADRLGITFNQLRYRLEKKRDLRADLEALVCQ